MTNLNHDSITPDLIDRYLADELSAEELRAFQAIVDQNPELNTRLAALATVAKTPIAQPIAYDFDAKVSSILSKTGAQQESWATSGTALGEFPNKEFRNKEFVNKESVTREFSTSVAGARWRAVTVALVAACLIVVSGTLFTPFNITGFNIGGFNIAGSPSDAVTLVTTNRGERSTVTLADGSTVTLNVASEIQIPHDYLSNRTIELTGEAYFNVNSSAARPFTVKTGDVNTVVLGTRFAVRSYPDQEMRVAVQTGKVSVAGVVLDANSAAHIYSPDSMSVVRNTDVTQYTGFISGSLYISNTPLKNAVNELSRWYNIDIKLADATVAEHLFGGIMPGGSVTDLAEILKLTLPVKTSISGNSLTISSE